MANLACLCERLRPGAILVWRTVPPIGAPADRSDGNSTDADIRAFKDPTIKNVTLTNSQIVELNRMILDLARREPGP